VKQILLASLLLVAACAYDTRFNDCTISCTNAGCPDGLECREEGLCREPGETDSCAKVLGTNASCLDLAPTCGPNGDEDCCSIGQPIPGGTFYRSYDVASDGSYPSTSYPATVAPFALDRFEVTVGRFRKFVVAGGGTQSNPPTAGMGAHRNIAASGWYSSWNSDLATDTATLKNALKYEQGCTWTDAPSSDESLPINCLNWYEAMAFCAWDGGYLPTEAEWNYAASGGNEQRAYPWSNPSDAVQIDCSYANYNNGTGPCVPGGAVNRVGSESPQGDGKWAQADLGGNVWEWTLDWNATAYSNPCDDCANLTVASARVDRGGYFNSPASELRGAKRGAVLPDYRRSSVGLRCARISP
jgi:formylglycine-generating enzyme required for sulfatase activity